MLCKLYFFLNLGMEREKKTSLKKRNTLTKLFLRKSKTLIKQQPQPAPLLTNQIHLCPLPVESAGLFHASADESSDQEHPISPVKEAPVIVTCKEKLTNLMTDINNTKSEYFKSSTEEEDETTLQLPHLVSPLSFLFKLIFKTARIPKNPSRPWIILVCSSRFSLPIILFRALFHINDGWWRYCNDDGGYRLP